MADVSVNISANTGNATNNVDQLARSIEKCKEQLQQLQEAGDYQGASVVTKQLKDLNDVRSQQEREQTIGQSQNQGSFTRMINQGTSTLGNLMGGNIGGAAQGLASLVSGIGKFAGIGAIVGGGLMLANKASESYENSLDTIQGLGRAYGKDIFNPKGASEEEKEKRYKANNQEMMSFYRGLKDSANHVGMAIDDFANAVTEMAKNGIEDVKNVDGSITKGIDIATKITARAGEFRQGTGAELSVLTGFVGLTKRYGNENNALDTAYRGLTASGMNRNQYQEYLQAVQGIIENGIENGFIASTEDVTKTLAMLAKASGDNELWKGQQGANRLAKVNSGFNSATELQSTSQVLMYQAIANTMGNTSSYVDVMKEMEHGIDSIDDAKSLADLLDKQYGNDYAGKIEELRNMFGFSYNDSDSFLKILDKVQEGGYTEEQFQEAAKDYGNIETPQETMVKVQNEIKTTVVGMGQNVFEIKYLLGNKFLGTDKSKKEISKYEESSGKKLTDEQKFKYQQLRSQNVDEAEALIGIGETKAGAEKSWFKTKNYTTTMVKGSSSLNDATTAIDKNQDGVFSNLAEQYEKLNANGEVRDYKSFSEDVLKQASINYKKYMEENSIIAERWQKYDERGGRKAGEKGSYLYEFQQNVLSKAIADAIRAAFPELSLNVNET